MVFGRGFLWVLVRLFVFYEACSPLPMGEGPGVRSGFGEGISYLAEHFVGIGGLFVFGRAFRGFGWAFRVWPSIS